MAHVRGIDQYVFIGDADGDDMASVGDIIEGGSADIESEAVELRGIGRPRPWELRAGLIVPTGSVDIFVKSADLLALAIRDDEEKLPEFSIDAGYATQGKKHIYAKCSSLSIAAAFKSALKASFGWTALKVLEGAPGVQEPDAAKTFMWYECNLASDFDIPVREVEFKVTHSIDVDGDLSEKETDEARFGTELVDKEEKIEVNVKLFEPIGLDIIADALNEIGGITITFTNDDGSLVVAASDLLMNKDTMPISPNDLVLFGVDFTGRTKLSVT